MKSDSKAKRMHTDYNFIEQWTQTNFARKNKNLPTNKNNFRRIKK